MASFHQIDEKRVPNLFALHIFCLKLAGQLTIPFANYLPKYFKFLGYLVQLIYHIIATSMPLHLALFHAKTAIDNLNIDLRIVCDALVLTFIYGFAAYSTVYWSIRSEKLQEFLHYFNDNYQHRSSPGLTFVNTYRAYKFTQIATKSWMGVCTMAVVLWAAFPIVTQQRILPLKCWYPFDVYAPQIYEIIFCIQILGQLQMGILFSNTSSIFISLVMLICGQYDALFCSLKNFIFHGQIMADNGAFCEELKNLQDSLHMDEVELNEYLFCQERLIDYDNFPKSQSQNTDIKKLQQMLRKSLKKCIQQHLFILEIGKRMEQLFNPFCLVKSLQVTFQMCFLAFVNVTTTGSILQTINLVQYLVLTTFELFMYTYFGETLRIQSLRVGEALMRSPWYLYSTLVRKDILIVLENSKIPIELTAGKFSPMDIARLKAAISAAFSFFTLLQKLQQKNGL